MLRILKGVIRNFLSIGKIEQTIDFTVNGLTLVLGENLDVGGTNSRNGAGKTTILQALSFGLFGKPLTKIRLDNLVNSINNKDMLVTIDFESRGKSYRIERGRKPAVLRFFCDGVQQREIDEAQGETKHTQTEIERVLGLSHKMFRHIVVLNTSTTPFLREELSVQREIIEELFGIMQLSQRAEALKNLIDITKEQLRDAEATIKANTEANNRITQAIERAKAEAETWQIMQNHRIDAVAGKAKALQEIDIEHELALFDRIDQWLKQQAEITTDRRTAEHQIAGFTQEIDRLGKDIARYTVEAQADNREITRLEQQCREDAYPQDFQPQIERLLAEVARRQREAGDKDTEADRLASEHASIMAQLAHPNEHTCATCGQGLIGTDHLARVLANLAERREQLDVRIARLGDERDRALVEANMAADEVERNREAHRHQQEAAAAKITALQAELAAAKVSLAERRAVAMQTLQSLQITLADLIEQRQDCKGRLQAAPILGPAPTSAYPNRDAVWQLRQDRDVLVNQLETELARNNPHATKIEGLQGTLVEIDYVALNELNVRYKHETFLHKLLTAKDSFVRKKIIDQNLKFLNKRLNHYLDRLRLPHEVAFRPDLTVEISLLGREFDFEQLSRGEMNRVVLATSFGFRDVWESLNDTVNLFFVDECLDTGMDQAGVEAALDALLDMDVERHKNVFLISHRDELRERIDHVMIVRKESQFTTFA